MMWIIDVFVYLLVGIFWCGAYLCRYAGEPEKHYSGAYMAILLFWPFIMALALGMALAVNMLAKE